MSSQLPVKTLLLAGLMTATNAITYHNEWGQSLDDCRDFAAQFDNTCDLSEPEDYEVVELDETDSVRISCQVSAGGASDQCGTFYNSDSGICEWDAILCVTCLEIFNQVYIRVQSNGLPQYCYYTDEYGAEEQKIDYEVLFNWDPEDGFENSEAQTQSELNSLLCDQDKTVDYNIPNEAEYFSNERYDIEEMGGIAFNGVLFFNSITKLYVDAWSPALYGNVYNMDDIPDTYVDQCLGNVSRSGVYHYSTLSPCIFDYDVEDNNVLTLTEGFIMDVDSDYIYEAFQYYIGDKDQFPIGIAKDGHLIWGPYDSSSNQWLSCDVDVCNGRIIANHYGYVATEFFPYIIGCYGPGSFVEDEPQCTQNPRSCGGSKVTDGWVSADDDNIWSSSSATLMQASLVASVISSYVLY